jgi:hypothetical protein
MATQKAVSANVQRKHGITVLDAGNASASLVTRNLDYTVVNLHTGTNGSAIPPAQTDANMAQNEAGTTEPAVGRSKTPTYKPYSAGTFAYLVKNKYIVLGESQTISGAANTRLATTGADHGNRVSIHPTHNMRTTFLKVWTWTGSDEGGPTYTKTLVNRGPQELDYSEDHETRNPRTLPGEFQYTYGNGGVTSDDYNAPTG